MSKTPEWIKCSERMPENKPWSSMTDNVLIHWRLLEHSGIIVAYHSNLENVWRDGDTGEDLNATITHWMPLPEKPEE
jgi:hypothetical protein